MRIKMIAGRFLLIEKQCSNVPMFQSWLQHKLHLILRLYLTTLQLSICLVISNSSILRMPDYATITDNESDYESYEIPSREEEEEVVVFRDELRI
jgi:hypothetical protein